MTLLMISRTLVLDGKEKLCLKPNYNTITDESTQYKFIPNGFIKKFVKAFKLELRQPSFHLSDVFLSQKAGPYGKATLTASKAPYSYKELERLSKLSDSKGFGFLLESFRYYAHKHDKTFEQDVKHRAKGKLSFIYDPECKLRIIAIVDYYTQLFLKPIHDKVMGKLKTLECDRTYTQDPHHTWESNDHSF